jgi:hypothetical protein
VTKGAMSDARGSVLATGRQRIETKRGVTARGTRGVGRFRPARDGTSRSCQTNRRRYLNQRSEA